MSFNSIQFLSFLPIVVVVLLLIPKSVRITWLLICSYYFYMSWNPAYALLLLFSTLITYCTGIILEDKHEEKKKKQIIAICCILNFAVLFVFKYLNFTIESINWILNKVGRETISNRFDLLLPVGISFYTFQAVGYIVDVYRGGKQNMTF